MSTPKEHRVSVDGGKYTFVRVDGREDVKLIDRSDGEPFISWVHEKDAPAIASMMVELDAARAMVDTVRAARERLGEPRAPQISPSIVDALYRHDLLVSNREPPSAWFVAEADRSSEPLVGDQRRLTDNEMVMAHQALIEAGRNGESIRFSALEKLIAFYKRSIAP